MTQEKKLKILGPYTPEHEGSYVWNKIAKDKCVVHAVEKGVAFVTTEKAGGPFCTAIENIMNAEEVPSPREFWIVGGLVFLDENEAKRIHSKALSRTKIIHVREVLPGEE